MNRTKMGFGRAPITPDGPVTLNSRLVGTDPIEEELFATCIAWQQDERVLLQYTLDVRGVFNGARDRFCKAISSETGVREEDIVFCSTHNHSGPDISMLPVRADIEDWAVRIGIPALCRAAKDALADLAELESAAAGEAVTEKVAFVRRYFRENGEFYSIAAGPSDSPIVRHESEADPVLRAVRFVRQGKKDVVLVNFQTHAAHALARHHNRISADFVGFLRQTVEAEGDLLCAYFQGACGNVNTFTRIPAEKEGWLETYWEIGKYIGRCVKKALDNAKALSLGDLRFTRGTLTCHVNHAKSHLAPIAAEISKIENEEERLAKLRENGIASRYESAAIIRRAKLGKTDEMPLAVMSCGEFAQGFAPVELFDTCGKAFREASPYEMTFFNGYSLGTQNYLPSAAGFQNGGYEALQCHYVPGTGEIVALELAKMLNEMKKA